MENISTLFSLFLESILSKFLTSFYNAFHCFVSQLINNNKKSKLFSSRFQKYLSFRATPVSSISSADGN